MANIKFSYSGSINNERVVGNGELCAYESTGEFHAKCMFDTIASGFHPLVSGVSWISISCSNGAKRISGAANIHSLTELPYRSIRTVSVVEEHSNAPYGIFRIDGQFSALKNGKLNAEVVLSGAYHGPTDLNFSCFSGYDLSVFPMEWADRPALFGVTRIPISHGDGRVIAKHEHLYLFDKGMDGGLSPNDMKVKVSLLDWKKDERILEVEGTAEMHPCEDGAKLVWYP